MPTIITAGDASNGLAFAAGNDGAVTIQSGLAGAKVNALSIAADGRVSTVSPKITGMAYARAYQSVDLALSNSVSVKVPFNTTVFNVGGNFNTTTNRFVATTAGYYYADTHGYFYSGTGSSTQYISIYKNGVVYASDTNLPAGVPATSYVASLIYLAIGDYLEVFAQKNAASWALYFQSNDTFFNISQISAE